MKTHQSIRQFILRRVINLFNNDLVFNGYLIMLIRLISFVTGFLFWTLAARLFIAQDVGLASSAIVVATLIASLAQFGYGYGIVRFLPDSEHPSDFINLAIETALLASICLGVGFLVFIDFFAPALLPFRNNLFSALSFIGLASSNSIGSILSWVFFARRKYLYSLLFMTLQSILAIILLIIFITFSSSAPVILYSYSIASMTGVAISFFLFIRRAEPNYKFQIIYPKFSKSPFGNYLIASFFTDQFQRGSNTLMAIIVLNVLGAKSSAYFYLTWNIAIGLVSLLGGVSSSLFVEGSNNPKRVNSYTITTLKLGGFYSIVICIGIGAASRMILSIFGTEYVANANGLFLLLLISTIPGIVTYIFLAFLRIRANSWLLMAYAGIDFALAMIASAICIQLYGLIGVGIGWLVSRLTMMILGFIIWKLDLGQGNHSLFVTEQRKQPIV